MPSASSCPLSRKNN